MMPLRELQNAFQARILAHQAGVEAELADHRNPDFAARLDAYVGGYRTRLIEALAGTYPALQATLGDEEFGRQMRLYIDSTPSRHWSVRHYGANLAERLPALAAGNGQALAELARWEWTLADVFDARDDAALDAATLGAVPPTAWATVSFSLRECVRRFDTRSNAVELWRAAQDGSKTPGATTDAPVVRWLLWRRGVKTLFRSLDPVEAEMLDAVRAQATFGALCERLVRHVAVTDAAPRAASLLRGWLGEELIAGYRCESPGK